ncbi:MAG: prolyl oligopeptidase family serine peptidase [Bradymonadia bacterium]
MIIRCVLIAVIGLGLACGEEPSSNVMDADLPNDSSATQDASVADFSIEPDSRIAIDAEAAVDAAPEPPPQPPAQNALERVSVETWRRGLPPADGDPLFEKYERGQVVFPDETSTGDADGVRWFTQSQSEDGTLDQFGVATGYAVTQIEAAPWERFLVRADRVIRVWTTKSVQPGDAYGSGRSLAPVLHTGEQITIAALANPRRGLPRIQVFKTTDEVTFNLDDQTRPDLLSGDESTVPIGLHIANLLPKTLTDITAEVLESDWVEPTTLITPGMAPGALSQLAFQIKPKAPWPEPETEVSLTLRISSPDLVNQYERVITLNVVDPDQTHRRSFITPIDQSVQYYGVRRPSMFDAEREYALVLSLHGASVEAIGQARAYSAKHWTYIIAPTNRRPFGFDWEEWGRLNALASLDDAMRHYSINETQVYLTGHSMGGHGTWHVGVTTPGRFATLGPSAGWESFYSYGGTQRPAGPVGRARAHSDTLNYLSNINQRGVYIIHGDADDNVPIREGRNMFEAASGHTTDIEMHEEPGAGHWWDGDASDGADCVDWPPLFRFMKRRRLDPWEADFTFRTPNAGYSSSHSFVELLSSLSPDEDLVVSSRQVGSTVELTTTNVRSMRIDREGLRAAELDAVMVNGEMMALGDDDLYWGPLDGKRPGLHGPLNDVFRRPFCFVYQDDDGEDARTAAFLTTYWALYGNGHACSVTQPTLTDLVPADRNLIRLGDTAAALNQDIFSWDETGVTFDGVNQPNSALVFVYPEGNQLSAGFVAPEGLRHRLRMVNPFGSRDGLPDYLIFGSDGASLIGHFDSEWRFDPNFSRP